MTQLEALKHAALLVGDEAMTAMPKASHLKWVDVADTLDALIKEVEAASTDTNIALGQAEEVLQQNGRYVMFWVSKEWLVEYMADHHMVPNDEELASAIGWLQQSEDIGTTAAAAAAMDEWMQQHWQV